MYFSCPGKISARRRYACEQPGKARLLASRKSTKRIRHRGGVECRAPARQRHPPLCIPPVAHYLKIVNAKMAMLLSLPELPARRRGFLKGAHLLVAPLKPLSLVTFLCGHKKVTRWIFFSEIFPQGLWIVGNFAVEK